MLSTELSPLAVVLFPGVAFSCISVELSPW